MNIEIPGFKTSRDFPSKNKLIIRYLNKHRLDIFKYFRIFSIYTFYFLQSLSKLSFSLIANEIKLSAIGFTSFALASVVSNFPFSNKQVA